MPQWCSVLTGHPAHPFPSRWEWFPTPRPQNFGCIFFTLFSSPILSPAWLTACSLKASSRAGGHPLLEPVFPGGLAFPSSEPGGSPCLVPTEPKHGVQVSVHQLGLASPLGAGTQDVGYSLQHPRKLPRSASYPHGDADSAVKSPNTLNSRGSQPHGAGAAPALCPARSRWSCWRLPVTWVPASLCQQQEWFPGLGSQDTGSPGPVYPPTPALSTQWHLGQLFHTLGVPLSILGRDTWGP